MVQSPNFWKGIAAISALNNAHHLNIHFPSLDDLKKLELEEAFWKGADNFLFIKAVYGLAQEPDGEENKNTPLKITSHQDSQLLYDPHFFLGLGCENLKVVQTFAKSTLSHMHVLVHMPELLTLPEEMSKEWQHRKPWQFGMYCGLLLHYLLPAATHLGSFNKLDTWFEAAHLPMGGHGLQEHVLPYLHEYIFDPLSHLISSDSTASSGEEETWTTAFQWGASTLTTYFATKALWHGGLWAAQHLVILLPGGLILKPALPYIYAFGAAAYSESLWTKDLLAWRTWTDYWGEASYHLATVWGAEKVVNFVAKDLLGLHVALDAFMIGKGLAYKFCNSPGRGARQLRHSG